MPTASSYATIAHFLARHSVQYAQRVAVTFVCDDRTETSWTYQELWERACQVAARLPQVADANPRALLLFPPGIDFLAGFIGCQIAGWVPVPTCYPRCGRQLPRLDSVARDCSPSAIVGDALTIDGLDETKLSRAAAGLQRIAICEDPFDSSDLIDPESLSLDPDSLAMLQYTSGSTSEPKGVMVRHRNLMSNLESIRRGFQIEFQEDTDEPESAVFWLPFFHDMGLIGGILAPLFVGGRSVLMSPQSFLRSPAQWLQLISDYKATISGAPNFAYQLCVDRVSPEQTETLDLHRWRVAFCGAEPVLPRTLQEFGNRFAACGFSSSAFYPCYGLAESTLLAAGGDGPARPKVLSVERPSLAQGKVKIDVSDRGRNGHKLVSSGTAAFGSELILVDPETSRPVGDHLIGEIWLRGESVAAGYWNGEAENETRFDAQLADGEAGYLRTGDLGFFHEGQLYVTGRTKDLIILRGRNHFPQDIEATVQDAIGVEGGRCAAFAVNGQRGEVLAIVAELPRRTDESAFPELVRSIRRSVIETHEVDPHHVLLTRSATVPITSSGKVRRSRCREMFDADEMRTKHRYDRSVGGEQTPMPMPRLDQISGHGELIDAIQQWLSDWMVVRAGVERKDIEFERSLADYGLDSVMGLELSVEIEDWSGIELTPFDAFNHPTIAQMSLLLVDRLAGDHPLPIQPGTSGHVTPVSR